MKTFTWNNFDEEFISGVVYSENTPKELRLSRKIDDKDLLIPTMELIAPYPTKEFVVRYRSEIENKLLRKEPEFIAKIYKQQSMSRATNHIGMLSELSAKPMGTTLIGAYISFMCSIGSGEYSYEERSQYAQPVTVNLAKSIAHEVPLYDFQEEAVDKLVDFFLGKDNQSGMLVMPTGSGKTRTATVFLLQHMISKGYQVIWLAHRHMLIDQTADAFYNFSPVIKTKNEDIKTFKMVCVSGEHSSMKATEKDDNAMIISIQSGCRSLDYLKKVLGKKVVIVVDEGHHTVAMSYRKTIDYIRKLRKDAKLLGLTATPIRTNEDESKYLLKLFDNNIVYDIPMADLIKKEVLAEPVFERIETDTNFESVISIDEEKLIRKFGEIPPTLANKIAHSSKRNKIIVDTYMQNKDRYGKTLIFALNAFHCFTLCEDLKNKGIRCDYIYSGNNDNESKIRRFKENELDVLVNINILTEGSDVPDIQTVFLTRPTQSEGLLMQMIGRGMRGKLAGGTEKAIIVDFCDKWDTFNKWLNPEWLIVTEPPQPPKDGSKYKPGKKTIIPWWVIREIYKAISFKGEQFITRTLALPAGWYPLMDEDGEEYNMMVYEEQISGMERIISDWEMLSADANLTYDDVLKKYFGGFQMPPTKKDMEIFIKNLNGNGGTIQMFSFEKRGSIDPVLLAAKFREENVGLADMESMIRHIYDENGDIIDDIFGEYGSYYERIIDCIKYHDGIIPISTEVEEMPVELIPFRLEPIYNLQELSKEVIDEMFGGEYLGISSIEWTDKPYKSYYGKYFRGGTIKINRILDSPDVKRETVKFVIYHELLHRDYWRHDKEFYAREHKYPDYTEHNRFLDYGIGNYKFDF